MVEVNFNGPCFSILHSRTATNLNSWVEECPLLDRRMSIAETLRQQILGALSCSRDILDLY